MKGTVGGLSRSPVAGQTLDLGVGSGRSLGYERAHDHGATRLRRGGRVVDRVALEMRSTRKGTGGSNPSLSAIFLQSRDKRMPGPLPDTATPSQKLCTNQA